MPTDFVPTCLHTLLQYYGSTHHHSMSSVTGHPIKALRLQLHLWLSLPTTYKGARGSRGPVWQLLWQLLYAITQCVLLLVNMLQDIASPLPRGGRAVFQHWCEMAGVWHCYVCIRAHTAEGCAGQPYWRVVLPATRCQLTVATWRDMSSSGHHCTGEQTLVVNWIACTHGTTI